jgi:predicted Rossmann-fold nucleotide-binding protein
VNFPEATIFGSSSPQEGSAEYQQAYDLAQFLAQQGFLVKNGGYYGTMEAASRGACDAGSQALGVPMYAG